MKMVGHRFIMNVSWKGQSLWCTPDCESGDNVPPMGTILRYRGQNPSLSSVLHCAAGPAAGKCRLVAFYKSLLQNIGASGDKLLPLPLTLEDAGESVHIKSLA